MIVKILQKSASFDGVGYNTNKIEKGKGELLQVRNFGALQAFGHLRPQDYINYLEAQSARSSRIVYPQFHAVISCEGKSHTKDQLSGIAEDWIKGMGYGEQPYLLIYHKDTANNHIHIVSTRVGKDGKKISDSFEKRNAYQVLNRILAIDELNIAKKDLEYAMSYRFSSHAQFLMLFEIKGYTISASAEAYTISKFGKQHFDIPRSQIDARIQDYPKKGQRIAQLRAILEKYSSSYGHQLQPKHQPLAGRTAGNPIGYTSAFTEFLTQQFGLQFIFHFKEDKPPYGYTIIDHAQKTVFKGGEVMNLKELIAARDAPAYTGKIKTETEIARQADHLNPNHSDASPIGYEQQETLGRQETVAAHWFQGIQLDIAADIDDEAINGRNRRRKRKARTNTR